MIELRARRGFTMITVLWVMTAAAIVAAAGALAGRNAVNAASNRVHLARAFWLASGCVARVQAAVDTTLALAKTFEDAADTWRMLGRAVPPPDRCSISLEAAGTRLDINSASEEMLRSLFVALGYDGAQSLAAAVGDWRESNGALADLRELACLRGFENMTDLDSVLTTEPGRISLATAPATVLLAVPGFTRETADRVVELERAGTPVVDVASLSALVSRSSADTLLARFAEVVRLTTTTPDAWIVTTRVSVGKPPVTVTLSRRLLRDGKRAVVVASRSEL